MTTFIVNLLFLLQSVPAATDSDQGEPAPVQSFSFDEEGGDSVQGNRDVPLIDWMCGVTKAKHESLIEIPVKRFFPELRGPIETDD